MSVVRKSKIMTFRKLELLSSSGDGGGSSFRNVTILDFRTMDKVQKPVSSQCYEYIPSSEHFRIYRIIINVSDYKRLSART